MDETTIIDTDILIDASRKVKIALDFLEKTEKQSTLSISTITKMELMVGCRDKKELKSLDKFLLHFQLFSLNEEITNKAVSLLSQYRLSHGLLIPDAIIAATAITEDYPFATKNIKDFRFIKGLKLLSYP